MKIQQKRSSALDGSVAKRPTSAQTEYGELCVNFNEADPSLFIRDTNDDIRKIGGDLSLYQLKAEVGSSVIISETKPIVDANGEAVKNGELWYCSSTEEDGGGRLYVYYEDGNTSQWVDVSVPGATLTPEDAENLYLSKIQDDTAAGAITFEETTTHEGGVKVTGEPDTVDGTVIYKNLSNNTAFFSNTTASGTSKIQLAGTGIIGLQCETAETTGVFAGGKITNTSDNLFLFRQQVSVPTTAKDVNGITSWANGPGSNVTGTVRLFNAAVGTSLPTVGTVYGYFADAQIGQQATSSGIGFYSSLIADGEKNYNFYAAGTAPNYFEGDVLTNKVKSKTDQSDLELVASRCAVKSSLTSNTSNHSIGFFGIDVTMGGAQSSNGSDTNPSGIRSSVKLDNTVLNNGTTYCAYESRITMEANRGTVSLIDYHAPRKRAGDIANGVRHSFHSDLEATDATEAFAVYSAGTALNYFRGAVYVGESTLDPTKWPLGGTAGGGLRLNANNASATSPNNAPIAITLGNEGTIPQKHLMVVFGGSPTQTLGGIRVTNASGDLGFTNPSDYRIKTNITPVSSVVEKIKNINVVSYTDNRFNVEVPYGFVAHELQEQVPFAVFGEKDAVEAIGTLTDWDGTELQTNVVEPSAEELTYTEEIETNGVAQMVTRTRSWSATSTRNLLQSVDQTKLIPLLTKALQEVMQKNEDLEARIAALEGA